MLPTDLLTSQTALELPARELLARNRRHNSISNSIRRQTLVNVGTGNGVGVSGNHNDSSTNASNSNSANHNSQDNGNHIRRR